MRAGALLAGGKNAHLLPVISKLSAAIETYNVRARLESSRRSSLTRLAGNGEANALVRTAKQYIEYFHLLLLKCPLLSGHFSPSLTVVVVINPVSFHWFSMDRKCFYFCRFRGGTALVLPPLVMVAMAALVLRAPGLSFV
jgi:hypothetical protein